MHRKSCLLSFLLPAFFFVLATNTLLFAQTDPASRLEQIVEQVKSQRSLAGAIEFVDWPSAFGMLADYEKKGMGVSSPEGFRNYQKSFLNDPKSFTEKQFDAELKKAPADQQESMKSMRTRIVEAAAKQMEEQAVVLSQTQYKVGESKVDGDSASVELKTTLLDKSASHNVKLISRNGSWYLPSLNALRLPPTFEEELKGERPSIRRSQ